MQPGDPVKVGTSSGLLESWNENEVVLRVFEQLRKELIATNRKVTLEGTPEPLEVYFKPPRGKKYCKRVRINGIYEPFEWSFSDELLDKVQVDWIEPEPSVELKAPEPGVEVPQAESEPSTPSRAPKSFGRHSSRLGKLVPKALFRTAVDDSDSDFSEEFKSDSDDENHVEDEIMGSPTRKSPSKLAIPTTPKKRGRPPGSKTSSPKKPSNTPSTPKKKARPAVLNTVTPKKPSTPGNMRRLAQGTSGAGANPETPKKRRHAASMNDIDSHRSLPGTPHKAQPETPQTRARAQLHLSQVPEMLPCRETQFSSLFNHLEQAIKTQTGTCIYVSGVPGTGKSSTVREVMEQLTIRQQEGEYNFNYIEVNGLRLAKPEHAYDQLHDAVIGGEHVPTKEAMRALETQFNNKNNKRVPLVVLMDELDQLVTKDQNVIYNFFNWPSLSHSRLVVIAIANTFDLPERMLQNKIKSRLGLTRIQFPGYTHSELQIIINHRLEGTECVVLPDAVEYIARKVGGVSGDARRALDVCRRAIECTPEDEPTTIEQANLAFLAAQPIALPMILGSLSFGSKLLFLAMCQYARRYPKLAQYKTNEILQQLRELFSSNAALEQFDRAFFPTHCVRMHGYQYAVSELLECGVISQDNVSGEATSKLSFNVDAELAKNAVATEDFVKFLGK